MWIMFPLFIAVASQKTTFSISQSNNTTKLLVHFAQLVGMEMMHNHLAQFFREAA